MEERLPFKKSSLSPWTLLLLTDKLRNTKLQESFSHYVYININLNSGGLVRPMFVNQRKKLYL